MMRKALLFFILYLFSVVLAIKGKRISSLFFSPIIYFLPTSLSANALELSLHRKQFSDLNLDEALSLYKNSRTLERKSQAQSEISELINSKKSAPQDANLESDESIQKRVMDAHMAALEEEFIAIFDIYGEPKTLQELTENLETVNNTNANIPMKGSFQNNG